MIKQLLHPFFVIMGPSGSGKTAITSKVFPKNYKVISHTTRKKRLDEVDGVDYYFETKASFQALIETNQLVEYDFYHGNYYGVGVAAIVETTKEHPAYNALTFPGFQAVFERFGESVIPVFFDVSKENIYQRLKQRESDPKIIEERLNLYDQEILIKNQLEQYPNYQRIDANGPIKEVAGLLQECIKHYY